MKHRRNIRFLKNLAKIPELREDVLDFLHEPQGGLWHVTDPLADAKECLTCLGNDSFCLASYLASLFLNPEYATPELLHWLEERGREFGLLQEPLATYLDPSVYAWSRVPVPMVCRNGEGFIRYALLGISSSSETANCILGAGVGEKQGASLLAVLHCLRNKFGKTFALLPLWGENVTGNSSGLPVYLAGCLLARNVTGPYYFLATGAVVEYCLCPVEHVSEKAQLCTGRYAFFLAPEVEGEEESFESAALLRVRTLEEAEEIASLTSGRDARDSLKLLRNGQNPDGFVDALEKISPALFERVLASGEVLEQLKKVNSRRLGERLYGLLEGWRQNDGEDKDKFALFCYHMDREFLQGFESRWQYGFLTHRIRCCMHAGDTAGYLELKKRRDGIAPQCMESWLLDENAIDSAIRELGYHHNMFMFPENVEAFLDGTQKRAIGREQDRLTDHPESVSLALAKWYGVLAENYCFLGAPHADKVRENVSHAVCAFGSGKKLETLDACQRQYSKLVHFYVDQADKQEAWNALTRYLGYSSVRHCTRVSLMEKAAVADKYALHAIIKTARLYDVPEMYESVAGRNDFQEILGGPPMSVKDNPHPWNLVLFNLAFLAPDQTARQTLLQLSFDLAFPKTGTIKALALLPLAFLAEADAMPYQNMEKQFLEIRENCLTCLSNAHFRGLLEAGNCRSALKKLRESYRKFFPFTYN